jgi:hypothetical protein
MDVPVICMELALTTRLNRKPTQTSLYLNSEYNYLIVSKKKQLFKAYTAQPLPCAMISKNCSIGLITLHTFCSSVGILCDLLIHLTVQQEEVIKNEIESLASA